MHVCNCTVRLGGELTFTVAKTKVTPAEISLLRTEHGSDAVVDIVPYGNIKRRSADEMERLRGIYPEQTIEKVFPGASPMLPQTVADVDIEFDGKVPDIEEFTNEDEADLELATQPQTAAGTGVTTTANA